ncbi:MAG: hypothetical protein SRB1_00313 [Desulfobacteraceae bacterium Eth-SRB1]|nr:MAG: hypothetical protein SRB1_00313 [Desulfobacteraceae bacterium Eth-SRB1]
MIWFGKQVLYLILFLNVLCIGSNVIAHPHIFIVQRLSIVFDNQGLTGFWVEWNFDEMFSSMIAADYDQNQNSSLEAAEVAMVKEKAFLYIAEYDYFVFVKIDGQPFKVKWIKDFNAVLKNGRLSYRFFVPCHVKAGELFKQIVIAAYDSSYFTAIFFARNRPAFIENGDRFMIESSIKEDKSTSIYFGMVNPWALFLKFRLKS